MRARGSNLRMEREALAERRVRGAAVVHLALIVGAMGCNSPLSAIHDVAAIREELVHFESGDNTLAGTLFLPDERGRHPAVVLLHGSGPQPRDAWTARWFATHGVAALAYDKRGVGESTGDFRVVPFMDLCDDGLAAIAWLRQRGDIDATRLGVWGLSQGGWLGPLAASRSRDVKFVVAVSGPLVSPGEQMVFFYANRLREQGLSAGDADEASVLRRLVWRYLSTGDAYAETKAALSLATARAWFPALQQQEDGLFKRSVPEIMDDAALRRRQWFRQEMNYDPATALRKLTVPALFIYGDQDTITPVTPSVDVLGHTTAERPGSNISIEMIPGADHGMRSAQPDGLRIIAPAYLEAMSRWLKRTLG
jgi:pimeloyl-ACP methyl ester carboxylesterase